MNIIKMSPGDRAELKKAHPCGCKMFKIIRVGSEVRIMCENCGRDLTLERIKFEKSIKRMIYSESEERN